MIMPERSYITSDYNFGYQGSMKDPEILGNGDIYTTQFRELDTRLGRWWSIDPKASYFAWQSPYASMNNNPIALNDVLGDSAWSYKNKWNDDFIKKFQAYSATKTEEYAKIGKHFTCEDLAITLAVDFASENNLPFQFTNGVGTFDPTADVYTSVDQYKTAVLKTSGANDLANNRNTSETSIDNAKGGDMILLRSDDSKNYNHTQVITKNTASQVDIAQGNLNYRILSQDPSSIFYGGVDIQKGSYYKGINSYYNKTKMVYHQGDFLKQNKATFRSWNFFNWNDK